jgi:hypothetical protein
MNSSGSLTPEIYKKIKKPFADTLYVLGVKNCDSYLPTDEEVTAMIQQSQEAAKNRQPSPADQKDTSIAKLNDVKAQQIAAEVAGEDAESQLDFMAVAAGNPKVYS